jgi:catechol 2,3-dioxygenase-like lactoylglutathione lyase family enzyme
MAMGVRECAQRKYPRTEEVHLPARGIHHVDLAVSDVARSIDFYTRLLGPLGLAEYGRYPSYRGTEEVVYFDFGRQQFGLRPADGGQHRYYDVGIEHIAFLSMHGRRWTTPTSGASRWARRSTTAPNWIEISRTTTRCLSLIPTASESRSPARQASTASKRILDRRDDLTTIATPVGA